MRYLKGNMCFEVLIFVSKSPDLQTSSVMQLNYDFKPLLPIQLFILPSGLKYHKSENFLFVESSFPRSMKPSYYKMDYDYATILKGVAMALPSI